MTWSISAASRTEPAMLSARGFPIHVAVLLTGCSAGGSNQHAEPAVFDIVEFPGATGVIAAAAYGSSEWAGGPFYGMAIDGFWSLDADDARRAYARAQTELTEAHALLQRLLGTRIDLHTDLRDLDTILEHFQDYDVQFLGFLIDGERRVMCNFFADRDERRDDLWLREWWSVDGGGCQYWTIQYDVDADCCLDFSPNASM